MKIPLFLAMTAAEFQNAGSMPPHPAWMACHFSAYGTGISNVPAMLPAGAMLMLNDRTPLCGHDPQTVAHSLCQAAQNLKCSSIALDFQREGFEALHDMITAVLDLAECPVGVSALYARGHSCPVLVPPIPPHTPPEDALAPWNEREIWLEVTSEGTQITVTEAGSLYTPLPDFTPGEQAHHEEALHCHYEITVAEDQIIFRLARTGEDLETLSDAVRPLGVTRTLGLWQEMK